ncbi:MAG: kelch repeat-containing protein, partial [Bacteroidia bacterium]
MKKILLSGAVLIASLSNIHAQGLQQSAHPSPANYVVAPVASKNAGTIASTSKVTSFVPFENYGWTSKPAVGIPTFGLGGSFVLNGNSGTSPGELFSIGGADFAAIYGNSNDFGTNPNSWSTMTAMPAGKFQFSVQKAGNKFYAAGGYNPNFSPVADMYIYDIAGGTWSSGAPMPVAVGDYASGVYADSLIYYIGGYSGLDENLVQIYNTITDTWTSGTIKPGTATSGIRGGINGDKIVVVGGYNQVLATSISDAYIGAIDATDPSIITWTLLPPYPGGTVGRLAAGVPYAEQRPLVVFVGGDPNGGGTSVKSDCYAYDVVANQWLTGANKTTAVSNISDLVGIVYNDSLWMASVAGYDGVNISSVNEWLNLGRAAFCGAALSAVNPCSGVCTGSVSLVPTGGTGPFSYLWSTGDTLTSIDSLCAGNYSVTITDSTGCTTISQVTLTAPTAVATSVNTLCHGDCNGSASVVLQGGMAPVTYLWSTSATTDSITNLCAGVYTVAVLDSNQCLDSTSVTITEPAFISPVFSGVSVLCNGQCNGSFIDSTSGGTAPYTLATCTGGIITPGTLCPGTYCVTVTDANGCTSSNSFIVTDPAPLFASSSPQDPSCFVCTDGFIDVNTAGGTVPYTITWIPANGNLSNDSIINLDNGIYTVTVTDANGCSLTFKDTLNNPVGIQNYLEAGNGLITLQPNPAADFITITINKNAAI